VGRRRDDITSEQRAQIVIEMLLTNRSWGTVTRLAKTYAISRQTAYEIAAVGEQVLIAGMTPGAHGPVPDAQRIAVNRNRLVRSAVVLTEAGVSQRDITVCLAEMLDTKVSSSWVNAELAKVEASAARVYARWEPTGEETLSGDVIYANGAPNLLLVGNDSLDIYALTRQPHCDGDTWGCILLDVSPQRQFASDGGRGLAAGAKAAEVQVHQLDWNHLLRPLWGQATRLEQQAYAALEAFEERAVKFDQAHRSKRLHQHLRTWERLSTAAEPPMARHAAFLHIAQQVDAQFALIDLESGALRDPVAGAACLRDLGRRLQAWEGRIYKKLSSSLIHWATGLFGYHTVLKQALLPLIEQWGAAAVQALSRIWQIEADEKRHPLPPLERQARQVVWEKSLGEAAALLGLQQLGPAWDAVRQVLGRSWRGSMLAECVNSLLRPVLDGRKHTDQGRLDLFRFLHNVRPFKLGKRAPHSLAHLVGLLVPNDPLTLLGLEPKVSI